MDIDVITEFPVVAIFLSDCSYASCIGREVFAMFYVLMIYVLLLKEGSKATGRAEFIRRFLKTTNVIA